MIFPRKQDLIFYANCLHCQNLFSGEKLEKKKKKKFSTLSAENFTQVVKC